MNWLSLLLDELDAAARAQGLSQAELARRAGMQPQHVCRLLSGKGRPPTTRTLARVAAVVGCRLSLIRVTKTGHTD